MSKTEKNLKEAFAGESQANRSYLAFAKAAEKEGHTKVAALFRAVAEAETVHAHAHLRAMGGIADTQANLQTALAGEQHEFKNMYPQMIADAQEENNKQAERSFTFANEVEKIHAKLYQAALDAMASGDTSGEVSYQVCSVCGYTTEGEAPDTCPICAAKKQAFMQID